MADFVGWKYDEPGLEQDDNNVSRTRFNGPIRKKSDGVSVRKKSRSLSIIGRLKFLFQSTDIDGELEEWETCRNRHTPGSLDALCASTNFSKSEIRAIYNGFKQECPNGTVNKERFKELYSQFFPLGDAGSYSGHVYDTLDRQQNGDITFEQFLVTLSVIAKGNFQEKTRWIFNLYDLNGDGQVTQEEMKEIVRSIYEMVGKKAFPPVDDYTISEHAKRIFHKMDLNQDGVISFDEFQQVCQTKIGSAILDNQFILCFEKN